MKRYIDFLLEAADNPRIPHPEDSIFDGSDRAAQFVQAMQQIVANPRNVSIKWDGSIALVFGKDPAGNFFIADKYMPGRGVYPKSPNEWVQYDTSRGANRADLYQKIAYIWPGLEKAVGNTQATYKGDLMFIGPLQAQQGYYQFKPVTVQYSVPVNSKLGKLITGRRALIVVHQQDGAPWSGQSLASNEQIAIISPSAGIQFQLKNPTKLSTSAANMLAKYGAAIDHFLAGMPKVSKEAISKYIVHNKIGKTQQPLSEWLRTNVSAKQYQFLIGDQNQGYLVENRAALNALIKTWQAISAFKENLAQQLETQVQGFQQSVNGQTQGEGFVFPSSIGLIKLVQRGGFTAAHFSGFNAKK